MKIFKFTAAFCAFALSFQTSFALKIDDTTIRNPNRFGIQFPNGTAYYGAANKIVSISKQSFFVDASPVLVTEICIELDQSPLQVRIYNARIIGADTLGYLSLEHAYQLAEVEGCPLHTHCAACFGGGYPTEVPKDMGKDRFENPISFK